MRNMFFPVLLALTLTACNSTDLSGPNSSDNGTQSIISIADNPTQTLTQLPDVDFNGQYQTTARTDLGTGGDSGVADSDGSGLSSTPEFAVDSVTSDTADSSVPRPPTLPVPPNPNQSIQPGTLTAGDYDDHLNPHLYQSYASEYLQQRGQWIDIPRLDFNNRILVEVTDKAGLPYADAIVEVTNAQPAITLHTAANGVTSLYNKLDALPENFSLRVTAADGTTVQQNIDRQQATNAGKIIVTLATDNQSQAGVSAVDVMFVVDTTGSMGDELSFLQTELSDIINAIALQESGIRIGLVFYRDYGDSYVVRAHSFSDNLNAVQLNLNQEQARGGGDYPEAMDQALQSALGADWRANSRKVLFLIADAPPHGDRMRATWTAAEQARLKNIHMVPVAASGVAEDAEYIMRSVAALTNSRYLFLTDDSGYGLSHAEPEVDCYVVTSLRKAMVRALNSIVTGQRIEPAANDVIRTVGDYDNGACNHNNTPTEPGAVDSAVLIDRQFPLNGTFTEQQTQIIANQNTLNDLLAVYGETSVSADFNAGQVVLVDYGQKSTGGYSVEISSIEEYDDHVKLNIVFRQPGSSCVVTQALTNPYTFVYVATQKEIRTSQATVSTDCAV